MTDKRIWDVVDQYEQLSDEQKKHLEDLIHAKGLSIGLQEFEQEVYAEEEKKAKSVHEMRCDARSNMMADWLVQVGLTLLENHIGAGDDNALTLLLRPDDFETVGQMCSLLLEDRAKAKDPSVHQVRLSNKQVVVLQEGEDSLSIAWGEDEGDPTWICNISANGVLTYPNSNEAVEVLTEGLKSPVDREAGAQDAQDYPTHLKCVSAPNDDHFKVGELYPVLGREPMPGNRLQYVYEVRSNVTDIFAVPVDSLQIKQPNTGGKLVQFAVATPEYLAAQENKPANHLLCTFADYGSHFDKGKQYPIVREFDDRYEVVDGLGLTRVIYRRDMACRDLETSKPLAFISTHAVAHFELGDIDADQ